MALDTAPDHLAVRISPRLRAAADRNPVATRQFAGDGLHHRIIIAPPTVRPADKYMTWHRERIFT